MELGLFVGGANADFFNLLLVYLIGRFLKQYPSAFLISNLISATL